MNDWYAATYYASSPSTNPPGPSTGTQCVLRGGAWSAGSNNLRSSNRLSNLPAAAFNNGGFRVARTP